MASGVVGGGQCGLGHLRGDVSGGPARVQDDAGGLGLDVHPRPVGCQGEERRVHRRERVASVVVQLDVGAVDLGAVAAHEHQAAAHGNLRDRAQAGQRATGHQGDVHSVDRRETLEQLVGARQGACGLGVLDDRGEHAVEVQRHQQRTSAQPFAEPSPQLIGHRAPGPRRG